MAKISVRIENNKLPDIVSNLQPRANRVAARFARDIRDEAKRIVPVDTGALKRSIRVVGGEGGELSFVEGGRGSQFQGAGGRFARMPEKVRVVAGGPSTPHYVNYAGFIEFGTRFQPAQPFMGPAAAKARSEFSRAAAWREIFEPTRGGTFRQSTVEAARGALFFGGGMSFG